MTMISSAMISKKCQYMNQEPQEWDDIGPNDEYQNFVPGGGGGEEDDPDQFYMNNEVQQTPLYPHHLPLKICPRKHRHRHEVIKCRNRPKQVNSQSKLVI
eukprot:sb/3478645/